MTQGVPITLMVCTYNRAGALRQTLETLGRVRVPQGCQAELLLLDNASTDHTADVIQGLDLGPWSLRYYFEGRRGKCHALNTGLKLARGEVILFTDDDVAPAADWAERLVAPMLAGQYDALTGRVVLAPSLERPWFSPMHSMWLALSLDDHSRDWSRELIGASMGIRRKVLQRVPMFDPELGPGPEGLGFCEDTLFGWQVAEAGFKIAHVPEGCAVHHLDPVRLQRRFWLDDAVRRGRTHAYLLHHWKHECIRWPELNAMWYAIKLGLRRRLQPPLPMAHEGCPTWEMSYVMGRALCRQFSAESRRAHNYERHGLSKRQP